MNAEDRALLGQLKLVKQGEFLGTTCDFYEDEQNNVYMTREQIGKALEYSDRNKSITNIHNRNMERFKNTSVRVKEFSSVQRDPHQSDVHHFKQPKDRYQGLHLESLLYNEDGIYEITFLSRQPKANEFRAWVRERIKEIRKKMYF
ncbi:MAG: BRO family protein [Fenollaria massiliensis]